MSTPQVHQALQDSNALFHREPARNELLSADLEGNGEVLADASANLQDHLTCETAPCVQIPAILVVPHIGEGREELVDEITRGPPWISIISNPASTARTAASPNCLTMVLNAFDREGLHLTADGGAGEV